MVLRSILEYKIALKYGLIFDKDLKIIHKSVKSW